MLQKDKLRCFTYYEFDDWSGHACSVQKSSRFTPNLIWLGVNGNDAKTPRMHLTQEHVKQLLPILQLFVETGDII